MIGYICIVIAAAGACSYFDGGLQSYRPNSAFFSLCHPAIHPKVVEKYMLFCIMGQSFSNIKKNVIKSFYNILILKRILIFWQTEKGIQQQVGCVGLHWDPVSPSWHMPEIEMIQWVPLKSVASAVLVFVITQITA